MREDGLPPHRDLTELIIKAFRTVYNRLGCHFLEQVYVGALTIECRKLGLRVRQQAPIPVRYDGIVVGRYRADLLINNVVVVEVKTGSRCAEHYNQLLNYLRCSRMDVAYCSIFLTNHVLSA